MSAVPRIVIQKPRNVSLPLMDRSVSVDRGLFQFSAATLPFGLNVCTPEPVRTSNSNKRMFLKTRSSNVD